MEKGEIHYKHEDLTVIWKPALCMHSGKCWKGEAGLKSVFDPSRRPWIRPEAESKERIIRQIGLCPSGALGYRLRDAELEKSETGKVHLKVEQRGPLVLKGAVIVTLEDGTTVEREGVTSLCRCGHSSNKPFCDGSHRNHQP